MKKVIKKSKFKITEVISGCAKGVDKLGERWAEENNIPVKRFPANWEDKTQPGAEVRKRWNQWKKCEEEYVFNAGFLRNSDMVEYGEQAILIPGEGSGTRDTEKKTKEKYGEKRVYVHESTVEDSEGEKKYEYYF